jgi:predicted flap endonuclease-1-like 5' DNA nuclease
MIALAAGNLMASISIKELSGIDEDIVRELRSAGIRTTEKFLEAARTPTGRRELASRLRLDRAKVLCWANKIDQMRIKGIGEDYAELLHAVGVKTVRDLKYRNPATLAKRMADANKKRKLVQVLPSDKAVVRWVESAKKLPIKIKY